MVAPAADTRPSASPLGRLEAVAATTGAAFLGIAQTVGGMGVDDKGKVKIIEANAPPPEEDENAPEDEKPSPAEKKKEEGKPKQK